MDTEICQKKQHIKESTPLVKHRSSEDIIQYFGGWWKRQMFPSAASC